MRYAVVDDRGDDMPDVYLFETETEAVEFLAWLRDTDMPGAYPEEAFVIPVSEPPAHWRAPVAPKAMRWADVMQEDR